VDKQAKDMEKVARLVTNYMLLKEAGPLDKLKRGISNATQQAFRYAPLATIGTGTGVGTGLLLRALGLLEDEETGKQPGYLLSALGGGALGGAIGGTNDLARLMRNSTY